MANYRLGGIQSTPPVIKYLILVNAAVFVIELLLERLGNPIIIFNLFALHDIRSEYFRPHQFVTHLFLHQNLAHIFFNMFALYMFGKLLEEQWGPKRFLIFYMACGLGAAALHLAVLYVELTPYVEQLRAFPADMLNTPDYYALKDSVDSYTIGASGAVFGCLAAFGYLFPNMMLYVYFFVPIKAKWFVLIYAGMEIWLGFSNSAGDTVAHWAHIGGALVGFLIVLYWNKTNRRNFY